MPTEQNQGINPNSNTTGVGNPVSNDLNQNIGGSSQIDLNLDGISIPEQNQNDEKLLNGSVDQPVNSDINAAQWGQSQLGGDPNSSNFDGNQNVQTPVEDTITESVSDDWLLKEDQAVENSEQNKVEIDVSVQNTSVQQVSDAQDSNVQADVVPQSSVDNFSGYQYQQPDSQVKDTEEDLSAMVDGLSKGPEKDNSLLMDWDDNNEEGKSNNEKGTENNEGGSVDTEEDLSAMVDGLSKGPEKENSLLMDWDDNNEGGKDNNEKGTENNEGGSVDTEDDLSAMVDGLSKGPEKENSLLMDWDDNNEEGKSNNEEGNLDAIANSVAIDDTNKIEQATQDSTVTETSSQTSESGEKVAEVESPKEDLIVENVGISVVENNNGELISDTGDFTGKTTGYIPNESEFQQMSQLLDSSKPGEVDLSSMPQKQEQSNSEVSNDAQVQPTEKGVFNIDSIVSSLQQSNQVQQSHVETSVETPVMPVTAPVAENVIPDNGQATNSTTQVVSSVDQNPVEQPVVVQSVESQSVLNQNQNPVGLDGVTPNVVANIPANNVQMPEMQQPVQQSFMPNGNVFVPQNVQIQNIQPGNIQSSGDIQQLLTQNEKTKSSHTGLYVILIVIILIAGGCFVLSKMYPDVFSAILGKNNVVVDYSDNSNVTASLSQDENVDDGMMGEELGGDAENLEDLGEELLIDGTENLDNDDIIDPDSLAAMIEGASEKSDELIKSQVENVDEHSSATEEFNPYGELGELIDEEKENVNNLLNKLNEYKSRAEEYQSWGTENNEQTVYKYGTYIVKKCTTMIENIDSGIEIDTNLFEQEFSKFDSYFVKMNEIKK